MITVTDTQLLQYLEAWIWPFLRIGGLVMAAPIIGTRAVPVRIRLILVVALSAVIAPIVPLPAPVDPFSAAGMLTAIHQILIGAGMGLALRLVFLVVEFAGQIIAQQMGLGFASLVDPQTGAQVPVLGQLYIILATLMFFAIDGHLVLIALLTESFFLLPVGPTGLTRLGFGAVLDWSGTLFSGAVNIALPVIISLLVVNLAFGVMAKSAPQLNIFAVGFPVMILFGVFLVFLTLGNLEAHLRHHFDAAFEMTRAVLARP